MIYVEVLRHLVRHRQSGACHKYSAILYVLLAEFEAQLPGDAPEVSLRIGVVRSPDGGKFDHSWVQYGPAVYDATVCLPMEGGSRTGGPVFASHDLHTGQFVHGLYTELVADELDDDAQRVVGWTLSEYASFIAQEGALRCGKSLSKLGPRLASHYAEELRVRYGETLRLLANLS